MVSWPLTCMSLRSMAFTAFTGSFRTGHTARCAARHFPQVFVSGGSDEDGATNAGGASDASDSEVDVEDGVTDDDGNSEAGNLERREAEAVDKTNRLPMDVQVALMSQECYLCGRAPTQGIDRVDPKLGYVEDNCGGVRW